MFAFRLVSLLIDMPCLNGTFGAVNNKLRIVDFSPDGWFNDSLQIAIKQLRFKVSSVRFYYAGYTNVGAT